MAQLALVQRAASLIITQLETALDAETKIAGRAAPRRAPDREIA
jgi:hypothetical protein